MPRALDLRKAHQELWERMVRHPFVLALGDGTLPQETFAAYMAQDRLFVGALVRTVAYAVAKAPDLATAKPLGDFLQSLLGAEDAFFREAFAGLGLPRPDREMVQPLPVTQEFSDFLVRTAQRSAFPQVATALFVTEGTYHDWATRLMREGRHPDNAWYREWIGLHADDALGAFVTFLSDCLEGPLGSPAEERQVERVFTRTLQLEVAFWDALYPTPFESGTRGGR